MIIVSPQNIFSRFLRRWDDKTKRKLSHSAFLNAEKILNFIKTKRVKKKKKNHHEFDL